MDYPEYDFKNIEAKWQKNWEIGKTFRAEDFSSKPKYYVLDMFPYPSGNGLHVGHPEGYTATDIVCRYKRMCGFNVLHPIGWDAFGLPAEQYALETGTHPSITTHENIANFKRQIKELGFSYDWDRELSTTDEAYYKWTQWIFIQLYKKGLAYIDEVPVNWCPALGTVLANEEVIDGRSERGGHEVVRKPMKQWMLRITNYADRLLSGLDSLDWSEGIKEMQRNWIGKSIGANVKFKIDGTNDRIKVFTTRPDTIFGVTYMVLSPEHQLVNKITTKENLKSVADYIALASKKSDLERSSLAKEKTGVFTGAYAINPANSQKIPIWLADYVLTTYGTGAIMAVPSHDIRDFEFAAKFNIPVKCIIAPDEADAKNAGIAVQDVLDGKECWVGGGKMINSSNDFGLNINGMNADEAKEKTVNYLEEREIGEKTVNYKLRDWLFSRQRYWGEPFPVVHMADGTIKLLDEKELPLKLPQVHDFHPSLSGESPLANAKEWLNYVDPETGKKGRRETNTMPQWAGSCWYYLRYIDPLNLNAGWDKAKEKYWMPVDLYVGGAEHAVLHLLYSRFWHMVLFDLGLVSTEEPFIKLINQGMILGLSYKDSRGVLVPSAQVENRNGKFYKKNTDEELIEFPAKMSKSLKNVVNPDDVISMYGADSMRLYEMFMGPLEAVKPWSTSGVEGVFRFLKRSWRLILEGNLTKEENLTGKQLVVLNQTIKKVTEDLNAFAFNTAISQMMMFVNEFTQVKELPFSVASTFVKLLSPFAPHIAEELWEKLGNATSIAYESWPTYSEEFLKEEELEIVVQILGKIKAKIMIPTDASMEEMKKIALTEPAIEALIGNKTIKKVVCVPGRLVNIVV